MAGNARDHRQHGDHSMDPAQRAPGNMSGQQIDETDLDKDAGDEGGPESSEDGNRSGGQV